MNTKQQAESFARQEAWKHKQTMYVVERDGNFYAASEYDLKKFPAPIISTLTPIKRRSGARLATR